MTKINWTEIIGALVSDAGLTQPEIAKLCGCGQSTISDLLRGHTTDPRTSTGLMLLTLAKQRGIDVPSVSSDIHDGVHTLPQEAING